MRVILLLLTLTLTQELAQINNNLRKGEYEIDAFEYCTIIDKTNKECTEVLKW